MSKNYVIEKLMTLMNAAIETSRKANIIQLEEHFRKVPKDFKQVKEPRRKEISLYGTEIVVSTSYEPKPALKKAITAGYKRWQADQKRLRLVFEDLKDKVMLSDREDFLAILEEAKKLFK